MSKEKYLVTHVIADIGYETEQCHVDDTFNGAITEVLSRCKTKEEAEQKAESLKKLFLIAIESIQICSEKDYEQCCKLQAEQHQREMDEEPDPEEGLD